MGQTIKNTASGLFPTYEAAEHAVDELQKAKVPNDDISIISNDPDHPAHSQAAKGAGVGAGTGAGAGALIGGGAGVLAGLGMLAIPGVGPVVAAGWLVATAVGAVAGAAAGGATGGLIGSLVGVGVKEEDAQVYAEGVRRGGTLVSVRAAADKQAEVQAILSRHAPIDIAARSRDYHDGGWISFDENAPPFTKAEITQERKRYSSTL